ncbi:MAG: MBL fold metallo-hydrolase [Candidatus Aminicenantes bacterium]|nr:MBL fold metallo-hydrolase [Candidatus Aminicenantes bacterium]
MDAKKTEFIFYGVRGSYPVADCKVKKYGGNTTSLLLERGEKLVLIDAGTGIINIGNHIREKRKDIKKIDIFLTHFHIDHLQGLPFFEPCFFEEYEINIYSASCGKSSPEDTILALFNHPYSPITNQGIKAKMNFNRLDVENRKPISLENGITIDYIREDSHPRFGVVLYRANIDGRSLVFSTDVETPQGFKKETMNFIRGADVLIHDSQYFDFHYNSQEYPKKGFGHSSVSMAVNNAINGEVKKLFLFHYDPAYSDKEVEALLAEARKKFKNTFLAEELKKFIL